MSASLFSRVAAQPLAVALCVAAVGSAWAQTPFYLASAQEVAGPPGSMIRQEPMLGAPLGSAAYRVLYRSTGLNGEPIAVSGVAIVPIGPAPVGGRPVIAWAHPTSGVVPHCAPSRALVFFQTVQGLREMLALGYAVVATDYPGLGTPGPHPYLVGVSEGRAVLDSVRATQALPQAGASANFAVWGHSQGGHAALYAGLLAKSYAPDLNLFGIAVAAPATDLATLQTDDFDTEGGKNLTAMTLWSWARVYGAPIEKAVLPGAMPTVDRLANQCIESIVDLLVRARLSKPLDRDFLAVDDLAKLEPWRSLMIRNSPGPLPRDIPVFIAQGTTDNVVVPSVTAAYMQKLCKGASAVQFVSMPGVGHAFIARNSANAAVAWMTDRFRGAPPPNDCP
jgi:acetyl esterase/lipase